MRRNPKLFQVPTLMLVDKAEFREADAAYKAGVKDLIDASSEPEEISGRVLELANTCRLHARLKTAFSHLGGEFCSDPETGVFNPAFLTAHLKRVSRDCRLRNLPLTILTIKLVPKVTSALKSGAVADALSQTIRNIADMVRMEDVVARMDKDTVIIAFPEEHRKDVARIAARITEMVETSTYPSIDTGSGTLRMAIQTAIVEQVEETSAAGEPVASRASVSA